MKWTKLMLVCTAILLPSISQAAEFWSGLTTITTLYPTPSNYIINVSYTNALSTCNNGSRFSIDITNPNYNALVSTLIAAFMAGKKINFNVDDSQGASCSPYINRFIVYP